MKPRILIIDDDYGIRFGFLTYLSKAGYVVKDASSLAEAKEAVLSCKFEAVLLDNKLPDGNGVDWIVNLKNDYPDTAVIVITGAGDVPLAVNAMRCGADNFLTKPVDMTELDTFLRKKLKPDSPGSKHLHGGHARTEGRSYFGENPSIKQVLELASLTAQNSSPVMLLGETGTGKGVLAKWIHDHGPRRLNAFVELNCSSLRGELLANELFGHARGAFTTAVQDGKGLVEVADGGTLFLDEIGDMDIGVQAQLLKVIEEKSYRRLGEVKTRKSDFRLICATNHDLHKETLKGGFRRDLYYRINVFSITMPPLRERPDDLPALVDHILDTLGSQDITVLPEVIQLMKRYLWPGNVRELKNVLEKALILARGGPIALRHFPELAPYAGPEVSPDKAVSNLIKAEEAHIKKVLLQLGGDTRKAAQALGISRATLYRKLKNFRQTP